MRYGNGLEERTEYQNRLQPQWIALGTGAQQPDSVWKVQYEYTSADVPNNGNVRKQTIHAGSSAVFTQVYGYADGMNRLTRVDETATSGGNWWATFGYDRYGNRWVTGSNYPLSPVTATSGTQYSGATNRIQLRADNQAMPSDAYDGVGNLTKYPDLWQMSYDGEGRLVEFTGLQGTVQEVYDGEGRRVKKVVGGSSTLYVYDAFGELAAEYNGLSSGAGTQYVTVDHLGSTRVVTDQAQAVKQRRDYMPFGEEILSNSTFGNRQLVTDGGQQTYNAAGGPTQQFTGKERDAETELDYFGARYFSGAQGRWTSPDWSATPQPVPYAKLDDPQTLNLYSYVRNNPLATADADGHTDYYTTAGKKLGNDGVSNGVVVVTKTQNPQRMEDGTIIAPSAYEGALYRFSRAEGEAIQSSVDRTLAPAGGDRHGGFHEEGFTVDASGIHVAAPGPAYQPGDATAHINQTITGSTTMIEHTHPVGTQNSAGTTFGGTQFDPKPSTGPGQDVPNARGRDNITHVEASAGNRTVYIYNGNGVQAQVPLSAFPRPEKDPK